MAALLLLLVTGVPLSFATQKTTRPAAQKPPTGRLTPLRGNDTAEGSRVTITSDMPLNDYSAYRSGNRFYVVIPKADAAAAQSGVRGRGFTDVQMQQRGDDVVMSFRLQPGASARVSQRFNRLDVVFAAPGAAGAASTTKTGNTNSVVAATRTPSPTPTPQPTPTPKSATADAKPSPEVKPSTDTERTSRTDLNEPDISILPNTPTTAALPPAGAVPMPTPAPSVVAPSPSDPSQIAQAVATPATTGATTQVSSTGTSLGATILRNWPLALLLVGLLVGIGLVVAAQAGGRRSAPPSQGVIKETKPIPVSGAEALAGKLRSSAPPATSATTPLSAAGAIKATTAPAAPPPAPAARRVRPAESTEAPSKVETKEITPVSTVDSEQVQAATKRLLDGESYDEAVINVSDTGMRQLVAAELLSALAGRSAERRARARAAFIKHGYFDDAVQGLRTADAPAERASAARSLGLLRDHAATPYLIDALEDPTMEVRRASVEALAEVRDPVALGPLETLREREKDQKVKVPRALIQRAVDASVAGEEPETPTIETVAPVSSQAIPSALPPVEETEETLVVEALPVEASILPEAAEVSGAASDVKAVEVVREEPVITPLAPEIEDLIKDIEPHRAFETTAPVVPATTEDASAVTKEIAVAEEVDPTGWVKVDIDEQLDLDPAASSVEAPALTPSSTAISPQEPTVEPAEETMIVTPVEVLAPESTPARDAGAKVEEKGVALAGKVGADDVAIPKSLELQLTDSDAAARAAGVGELTRFATDDAFDRICAAFDDPSPEVRNAAARALYNAKPDRADSFTRALREAASDRRRNIGAALAASGLASEAISHLTGEGRDKTYDAFSLLFLMAKAGELGPLIRAIESHPENEVRLAVVKLLALSGQHDILPAFRRLAVRGSLPAEVRSAVMEAIYQISSQPASNASQTI